MSRLGKTIISLVSAGLVAVAGILLYVFWPAITGTINENKYYTAEDVQTSYDKGFNDGNKSETELTAEITYYKTLVDDYEAEVGSLNKEISDELLTCRCGGQYIYGFKEAKINSKCPYCNTPTKTLCTLQIGKNLVLLEPSKSLYKFHLDKYSSEYNQEIAKVIKNKNNPSIWGIKLNIDSNVQIKDQVGNVKEIANNGVIPIIQNLKIKFNEELIAKININSKGEQ